MSLKLEAAFEEIGRKYFDKCKFIHVKYMGPLCMSHKIYLGDSDNNDKNYSINWPQQDFAEETLPIFEKKLKALKEYINDTRKV